MITFDIYGVHHDIWRFANELCQRENLNIDLIDLKQKGLKTTVIYENNVIGWIIEELKAKGQYYRKDLTFFPNK